MVVFQMFGLMWGAIENPDAWSGRAVLADSAGVGIRWRRPEHRGKQHRGRGCQGLVASLVAGLVAGLAVGLGTVSWYHKLVPC